nr:hypothetical protein [candidate division KSB1 bacterium]NIU26792.1 hypothetical protein [candidate division KSB1 bacterium]NIW20672.1 hypothetical protein [candidate division KSB1 bacterium]NIW71156.1 hypothetical protein [candidate division KSB1 bacterium]
SWELIPDQRLDPFKGWGIEVDYPNVTIYYTILLDTKKADSSNSEVLPIKWNGSSKKVIDRTFKTSFRFPRKNESLLITRQRRYRNPIILVQELDQRLSREEFTSKAEMARALGYSRARITQLLNLLSLSDQIRDRVRALGDYWMTPFVTERKLRSLLSLGQQEQIYKIETFENSLKVSE